MQRLQAVRSGRLVMHGIGPSSGGGCTKQAVGTTKLGVGGCVWNFFEALATAVGLNRATGTFDGCLAALCQQQLGLHTRQGGAACMQHLETTGALVILFPPVRSCCPLTG